MGGNGLWRMKTLNHEKIFILDIPPISAKQKTKLLKILCESPLGISIFLKTKLSNI